MLNVQEVLPLSPRSFFFFFLTTKSTVTLLSRSLISWLAQTCQLIKPTHVPAHCYSNHLQQGFTTGDLHSGAVKIDSTQGPTHQKGDTAHPFLSYLSSSVGLIQQNPFIVIFHQFIYK